jgi:hypothetical protein
MGEYDNIVIEFKGTINKDEINTVINEKWFFHGDYLQQKGLDYNEKTNTDIIEMLSKLKTKYNGSVINYCTCTLQGYETTKNTVGVISDGEYYHRYVEYDDNYDKIETDFYYKVKDMIKLFADNKDGLNEDDWQSKIKEFLVKL